MVEVKAEAEAARELYAANKEAGPKRAKITKAASPNDLPAKRDISLTSLSLSESKDDVKQVTWSNSTIIELFQGEVDATLQSMQELGEEARLLSRDFEDIGKIILRRAAFDDCEKILSLLSKNNKVLVLLPKKHRNSSSAPAGDGNDPSSEGEDDHVPHDDNQVEDNEHGSDEKCTHSNAIEHNLLGENSIILVLSRAVALHEPLLACAVLTVNYSGSGRSLSLCRLSHEGHLPLERFIEYLEAFATNIQCTIENCKEKHEEVIVTIDAVRSYLVRTSRTSKLPEDDLESVKGNTSHLQSVKEEESEEVEDGSGSDGGEECTKPERKKRGRMA
jgi:hypothetical protein